MPIKIENISYTYQQGTPFEQVALKNVSITVDRGDILGITGATGSGKSTLLQMLNGLIIPTQGRVLIDKQDTAKLKGPQLRKIRQKVGLVYQLPEQQIFELTVEDEIAFGPKNIGLSESEVNSRVRQAMQIVDLDYEQLKNCSPFNLSSGQKRRIAIAGVLAMDPEYIILDEPFAGLDAVGKNHLLEQFIQLNREKNRAIILVSHHLEDLAAICERLLVLNQGQVLLQGDLWTVLKQQDKLIDHGFKLPVPLEIMYKLRQKGWNINTKIRNIDVACQEIIAQLENQNKSGNTIRGKLT